MYSNLSNKKKPTAAVVVLGDLGHSPRMQNHCQSLLSNGWNVYFIGYTNSKGRDDLWKNPNLQIISLTNPSSSSSFSSKSTFLLKVSSLLSFVSNWNIPKYLFPLLILKGLIQMFQLILIFWIITFTHSSSSWEGIDFVLIQNPPFIPILPIYLVKLVRSSFKIVVDWHNFGYTLLELKYNLKNTLNLTIDQIINFTNEKEIEELEKGDTIFNCIHGDSNTNTKNEKKNIFINIFILIAEKYEMICAKYFVDFHICVTKEMKSFLINKWNISSKSNLISSSSFSSTISSRSSGGSNVEDLRKVEEIERIVVLYDRPSSVFKKLNLFQIHSFFKEIQSISPLSHSISSSSSINYNEEYINFSKSLNEIQHKLDLLHKKDIEEEKTGREEDEEEEEEEEEEEIISRTIITEEVKIIKKKIKKEEKEEIEEREKEEEIIIRRRKDIGIIVSSTSWTSDEDFSILLKALYIIDTFISKYSNNNRDTDKNIEIDKEIDRDRDVDLEKRGKGRGRGRGRRNEEEDKGVVKRILIIITGKGPLREYYQNIILQLKKLNYINKFISIEMIWLSFSHYISILSSSNIGLSFHFSSSGLDLPMKVIDMFSLKLPVLSLYYHCIQNELLFNSFNSLLIKNNCPFQLSVQILYLFRFIKNNNNNHNHNTLSSSSSSSSSSVHSSSSSSSSSSSRLEVNPTLESLSNNINLPSWEETWATSVLPLFHSISSSSSSATTTTTSSSTSSSIFIPIFILCFSSIILFISFNL